MFLPEQAKPDVSPMFAPNGVEAAPAPALTPAPAPLPAVAPAPGAKVSPAEAAAPFAHYADAAPTGDAAAAAQAQPPGLLDRAWHAMTDWHFEGRDARNGKPPTEAELKDPSKGWQLLPPWMSVYHDDGVGNPERKYVNPDGRESVKNGDTGAEVNDPRYKATYNYVTPMDWNKVHGVGDAAEFAARSAGHFAADILPYWIGGNVRGPG